MKRHKAKLTVNAETLRTLDLQHVAGGVGVFVPTGWVTVCARAPKD